MRKDADITVAGRRHRIVDLPAAAEGQLERLPYILRIMLENVLRNAGDDAPRAKAAILNWLTEGRSEDEIPFLPGRVMMHDTTCGPALVDIAGMRASLAEAGYDPRRLNPVLPVDVSTDHSLAVDVFGAPDALRRNMEREFGRNAERYRFMKWATRTLSGVRVHPPGTGIMHTLNLERLATCRHHRGARRRVVGHARYPDRHGQSHADDQRHRRARLGRGRPRGRERLLRHAGDDPRAGHRRRAPYRAVCGRACSPPIWRSR